jgi:hypothetical protein
VALRVLERHSLSLQAEKRRILEEIRLAKRSRRRRERLLQLAREKGFQFCLERLISPGMTLERSPYYGVSAHCDQRTTPEHEASLNERLRAIRREIRHARNASPEPVEANLRGLLDEAELVSKKPPEIRWVVENVELQDVWIGDLEVNLSLDDWVSGVGTACYECGERYSDDDLVWAEDVDGSLCESCRSYCDHCQQYVCYRHYDRDFAACTYCVEEHAITCGGCSDKFWEADLESIDVSWFNQPMAVLLCEDCAVESEETEGIYEDFNAGEVLRGWLEMTLAMVQRPRLPAPAA